MERWQIQIIRANLPELIDHTVANTHLLALLQSKNIISQEEVEDIESNGNHIEKGRLLYDILRTRTGGYEALLQALSETKQTGALKILTQSKYEHSLPKYTTLFHKNIVNLDAALTRASVIFISTVDAILAMAKVHATLPAKYYFMNFEKWKDIKNALQERNLFDWNFQNQIWAVSLHTNLDWSEINVKALLERHQNEKFLFVSENDLPNFDDMNEVAMLSDTFTWDQIKEPVQMRVLSQNILDQGKSRKLSEFCKSYVYENVDLFYSEILKGKLLAALLKGEVPIVFRSTIPPLRHYVSRCLRSRYRISTNIFYTNSDHEVFAFSGKNLDIDKLREIGSGSTGKIDTATNQFERLGITAEYILLEFKADFNRLCEKLKGKKTVHRLKVHREKLVWEETVGDNMTCLQSNILEEKQQVQIREEDFLDVTNAIYENRPRILCDSAGMGKSVLLAKLAQDTRKKYPEKSIVVFFVMTDFIISVQKAMQSSDQARNRSLTAIIHREIAAYACMYQLPESIFEDRGLPLYLFFDGLDEIPANTVPLALSCFENIRSFFKNACIYVSTRPELLSQIESALSSLALNIDPFNENNQIKFLTTHWSYDRRIRGLQVNTIMLRELAKNSLVTLRAGLSNDDKDIAGVPLQCLLLAEVLKLEAEEFADPDNTVVSKDAKPTLKITSISQLYDLVFERKFEAFKMRYLEKDQLPLKIPCLEAVHLQIGIETIFPEFDWNSKLRPKLFSTSVYTDLKTMVPHWQATFSQFQSGDLPQRDILRVGIVESVGDGKWQFVHRTFGEYIVAMFTTRQISANKACDQDILEFVQNTVLKTDLDEVPCSMIQHDKKRIVNRTFKYPVICHFINSWIHRNEISDFLRPFRKTGSQSNWQSIVAACIRHNYPNMLETFSKNVNFESSFRTNILYLAACYATEATFEKLEGLKPLLSISNPSLLHVAVEVGNAPLVSYLLSSCGFRKAIEDSRLKPVNDLIPCCVANTINASPNIIEARIKILHLLLKCKGIYLSLMDQNNKIPISQPRVHASILCEMIQRMTSDELRNEKDQDDRTILHIQANYLKQDYYHQFLSSLKNHHPEAASSLVKYRDWFGQTPLHYLVSKMEPTTQILGTFMEIGVDFDSSDFTGYTIPWTVLQYCRNKGVINHMLKQACGNGQLVRFNDPFHRTSLHIAACHIKLPNLLESLISQGYDVNKPDHFGNTPLFYALRNPNHEISRRCIEILHNHKANLHHKNQKEESLFHVAAQQGNVKAMELLFQLGYFGGNIGSSRQVYSTSSLVDRKGNTPLHHALVCSKQTTISTVQFLVSRFLSDVNHLNNDGHCPLQHGLKRKGNKVNFDVIEYLERSISHWPQELITRSLQAIQLAKKADLAASDKCDKLTDRILSKERDWRKAWRYVDKRRSFFAVVASILLAICIALYNW